MGLHLKYGARLRAKRMVNPNEGDAFGGFHPWVNVLYFAAVIGFVMFFMHPVLLGISLLSAATYAVYLRGKKIFVLGLSFLGWG